MQQLTHAEAIVQGTSCRSRVVGLHAAQRKDLEFTGNMFKFLFCKIWLHLSVTVV